MNQQNDTNIRRRKGIGSIKLIDRSSGIDGGAGGSSNISVDDNAPQNHPNVDIRESRQARSSSKNSKATTSTSSSESEQESHNTNVELISNGCQQTVATKCRQRIITCLPTGQQHLHSNQSINTTTSDTTTIDRPKKVVSSRVDGLNSSSYELNDESDECDHDGDIEMSHDDDNDDYCEGDTDNDLYNCNDRLNVHSEPSLDGRNADHSLARRFEHFIDETTRSSSRSSGPSSDKPIFLRPRMRFLTNSKTNEREEEEEDKPVQGNIEQQSDSSDRVSYICREIQDHKSSHDQHAGKNNSLPLDIDQDNNNNNHCVCERTLKRHQNIGNLDKSSSQFKTPERSIKCGDPGGWSNTIQGLTTNLKRILKLDEPTESSDTVTTCQTRRRKSRRLSAFELKRCQLKFGSANNKKSSSIESLESNFEWPKEQSGYVTGVVHQDWPTMQNINYGSADQQHQLVGRRASNVRRTSRARNLSRSNNSYSYLRLGNDYYRKTPTSSLLQELKRILLLLFIIAICGIVLWQIYEILVEDPNYLGTVKFSPSILGEFDHYAVSTDAKPCAKIGKMLLAKGGHAVDAAIGTLICMGIALPNSLGIGGGCLMTIYDNVTKTAIVVDGRETAPAYATEGMFAHNPLAASRGPLSTGIPGELAAYWEAHQRFGRLKWSELFDDSIKLAEQGFPTVGHLSAATRDMNHAKYIRPQLKKILTNNATGDYYKEGEIMYLPELADTLKRIRDNGVKEFYNGTTGQLFVDDLKLQGGKMTMDDLRNYRAGIKDAAVIQLGGDLKVYTQPIPGSGLVLSIILRIMRELGYYKNLMPQVSFEASALYYHHLAEALKFAYAQRAGLEDKPNDPDRMKLLIAEITSDAFIKSAVSKIDNSKTLPSQAYGGLEYFQEDHGTAHTSVIDNEGNSVAITTSVNLYFGSGLVSPRTGIIYNDVMDDFTSPNITNKFALPPSKYNRIKPGRRPISSMAPSIFVDSKNNPRLLIGASGGSMITSAIATVALRNLFFDEDLKTAIDGPRIHHQFLPDRISFEANFSPEILSSLRDRGHRLQLITGRSSVVMGIACNYTSGGAKHISANSDYRKGGSVDGL